jgi:flagella basal body P-ring formation protein FlgA
MGNTKTLLISAVLTGFAILLIMTFLKKKENEITKDMGVYQDVLVANQNIPQYRSMDEQLVSKVSIPKKYLQPNYITDPKDIKDTVTAIPISKNETITTNKLMFLGGTTGLRR